MPRDKGLPNSCNYQHLPRLGPRKYAVNLYCLPPLFWIYPRGRNVKKHHLVTQPAQLKRENHTQAANYEKKQVVNKKNRLFKTRISLQPYCIRAGTGSDSVHLSSCLFKILFLKSIFFIWWVLAEGGHLSPQHPVLFSGQLVRVGFLLPACGFQKSNSGWQEGAFILFPGPKGKF